MSKNGIKQIQVTRDYDKFSFVKANRRINPKKVVALAEAMKTKNLLNENPITVTSKYEIVSGQHRFLAAKMIGASIYYIVSNAASVEDMPQLEWLHDKWKMTDHLDHYVELGRGEYKKFKQYWKRHGFGITTCMQILSDAFSHKAQNAFRRGEFQVTKTLDEAEVLAEMIHDFGKWKTWYRTRCFVLALLSVFKNPDYQHGVMMAKLEYQSTKLVKCPDVASYKKVLEDIYNHMNRNKIHFS